MPRTPSHKNKGRIENLTNKGKGRPPGVPNKATREIKTFCRALFERKAFQQNLLERWDELDLDSPVLLAFLYYAFGKPKETIEHEVGVTLHDLLKAAVQLPDPGPKLRG